MRGKSLENLNRDATFEDSEYCVGEKMKKKLFWEEEEVKSKNFRINNYWSY